MTTRSRSLRFFAVLALLAQLTGCSTRWTPMEPPPPATAQRLRILPAGHASWLEIHQTLLVGDSLLVWIPDARLEGRVPPDLAKLYMAGRIALKDVTAVAVAEGKDCGTGCKASVAGLGLVAVLGVAVIVLLAIFADAVNDLGGVK